MTERLKCMFDSNIFDEFIDRPEYVELITGSVDVVATHIQRDQINDTPCAEKRMKLCRIFHDLVPDEPHVRGKGLVSTESAVWNISKWNSAKWSSGGDLIEQLRGSVKPDAGRSYVRKTTDALIAETAIKNSFTLVTKDNRLRKKVTKVGGKSMTWEQLREHCRSTMP